MNFFEELCDVLTNEAKKHPGVNVSVDEWVALNEDVVPKYDVKKEATKPLFVRNPVNANVDKEKNNNVCLSKQAPLDYEGLCKQINHCKRCSLRNNCETPLEGCGSTSAELMFVYDAPTLTECAEKRNINGEAGKLFEKIISAMGYKKEEVYVTTVVKCPVSGGAGNLELSECIGYLQRQIALIKPRAIVILGASATRWLLGRQRPVLDLLGKWSVVMGVPALPTYNPAFLLAHEDKKRQAWHDLQQVMSKLGKK